MRLGRPVGGEGAADDPVARNGSPEAAVVGCATVVAHHEVVVGGNRDLRREVAVRRRRRRAAMNGSSWRLAVADHVPVAIASRSPGPADDALDEVDVGLLRRRLGARLALGRRAAAARVVAARRRPAGGRRRCRRRSGSPKRLPMRLTSTRWPTSSVGTIDSLGIRYGLTRNAWMPSASPSATATIMTSSSSELPADALLRRAAGLRAARPCRRRARVGLGPASAVRVAAALARPRRPAASAGVGLGGLGVSAARLVDLGGDARHLDGLGGRGGRGGVLRGGIVQQARLDDLLRARCSGARARGRACRRGRAGSRAWRGARRRGRRPRSARSSASAPGTCAPRRRRRTACGR